jgi:hypothetical protein
MNIDWEELELLFEEQFGDLPVGGWLNPTFEHESHGDLIFRCYYDNFDNEEDSWHYSYDVRTKQFCAA